MGTSYSEIYSMNRLIKSDSRLSKLDACELNSIRFGYLKFAISYFIYDCRQDLTDRIDPVFYKYEYTANGQDTNFVLNPAPDSGSNFVVYVVNSSGKTEVTDFTFNQDNNEIVFQTAPADGDGVIIKAFTVGAFNITLDIREINILAEGMNVPYLEESKNDENAMKYIISGSSLRFFSQANHLNSMTEMVNSQMYKTVDALISEYSYKGSTDNYKGLAGRGG